MKKIAIIPARSGSKGIVNKNIKNLCGKPLIAYSIEEAIKSNEFEGVYVTTNSKEYADISKRYGAKIIMRDESISNDDAPTFVVIKDALEKINNDIDYFVLLQPTSPMRESKHIREACKIFEDNFDCFDFMVSVKEADHNSDLVKPIDDDLSLKYFDQDYSNYKRQNSREYSPNGAIFIAKPNQYLQRKHFYGNKSIGYIMNKIDSIDIDDNYDFMIVEMFMKKRDSNK